MNPAIANTRSRNVRRIGIIGAVLVIAVLGAWALVASKRRDASAVSDASRSPTSSASPSMAGMSTTTNGTVMLTADQIRTFGITFGTVEVRPLTAESRTTGVVTFDETRMQQVAPKISGFVERLYVNATGQRVRRGQPLMEVYSPELVAAQQDLLLAGQLDRDIGRSAVPGVAGNTSDLVAASRRRLQLLDISNAQIDEILRSGHVRRTLTLYAPSSGVVMEKKVLQGQSVVAGESLFIIADLSDVWIDVQLRESNASSVRVGSGADIELGGVPPRTLKGRVAYVYPTLDSATRAVRARVAVSNAGDDLKPGMYATVRLSTPTRSALTVPSSAILRTGERSVVFMDMGKGELMPMDVQVGGGTGAYTEIISGVDAGARVVTSAQFLLDSESNLGEVMKSMISQGSAGDKASRTEMKDMPGMPAPTTQKR
ncbi:MAG: efflux RND transporter periplasmic adaptor subunit [Gemmatimonadaceae bacterium]